MYKSKMHLAIAQILTLRLLIEGTVTNNLPAVIQFFDSGEAFDSYIKKAQGDISSLWSST